MIAPRDDPVGAFCPPDGAAIRLDGHPDGPLVGLEMAVADVLAVRDHVTGFGNPDWRRTHGPAATTAPVITTLIDHGATLVGVTLGDELGSGLLGINTHYGTPRNPV